MIITYFTEKERPIIEPLYDMMTANYSQKFKIILQDDAKFMEHL